jgi:DNA-3-methyladenine glycosylase II
MTAAGVVRTGTIPKVAIPAVTIPAYYDPAEAVRALAAADPVMAGLIGVVGQCRLTHGQGSPYESLGRAIVYQQLTGKAAAAILGRLKSAIGKGKFPSPRQILAAGDDELRAVGLSRAKVAALRDLAEKKRSRWVPTTAAIHRLGDDAIVERLTAIRGIGRWTVEMLLIFYLGRADVLPVHDYGVRKGFAAAYRKRTLPTPKQLLDYGERWRPYRSIASWYLWRAAEMGRRPAPPVLAD